MWQPQDLQRMDDSSGSSRPARGRSSRIAVSAISSVSILLSRSYLPAVYGGLSMTPAQCESIRFDGGTRSRAGDSCTLINQHFFLLSPIAVMAHRNPAVVRALRRWYGGALCRASARCISARSNDAKQRSIRGQMVCSQCAHFLLDFESGPARLGDCSILTHRIAGMDGRLSVFHWKRDCEAEWQEPL